MQSKSYPQNCARFWRPVILLAIIMLCAPRLFAQLVADFSVDRTSGCAPLTVLFTNKTTGASPAARYAWNFGNGNTSTLLSPGATYRTEQTYTVTLTVTDGGKTSTKTAQVTVYKKPAADFFISAAKGCLPLQVSFRSAATAGDGALTSYIWDFGDGTVQRGGDTAGHTYNFAQKASVSLTVTNQYGCFTTVEKKDLIQVLPAIKAEFAADKKLLCNEGDAVQFTNASSGPGTLSYQWSFGDGGTATAAAPKHIFLKKGTYGVKLKVSSSEGCTAEKEVPKYINVADFRSTMQLPQAICAGAPASLQALTLPVADSVVWNLGDGRRMKGATINAQFKEPGTRTISFTAFRGGCAQVVQQAITVRSAPELKGFVKDVSALCQLPGQLRLQDTTAGAVKWIWQVGNGPEMEGASVSPTITSAGTHPVRLTITGSSGCSATVSETVDAGPPQISINAVNTTGKGLEGCTGMKLRFSVASSTPLVGYQWRFGDGGTATGLAPEYTFNNSGRYTVHLDYKTAGGCTGTVSLPGIAVFSKPNIDFIGPKEACSSNPVGFSAKTDTAVQIYRWFYTATGSTISDTSTRENIQYKFMTPGVYTVTLIANSGTCADTVVKKDFIQLKPPFQYLEKAVVQCAGDRSEVSFPVFAHAESMVWNFGDGTTHTINGMSGRKVYPVVHQYKEPGWYKAVYKSYLDGCEARDSVSFFVSPKEQPKVTLDKNLVCPTDTLGLQLSVKNAAAGFSVHKLFYSDGSAFGGKTRVVSNKGKGTIDLQAWSFDASKKGLRAVIQWNVSGCLDTSDVAAVQFSAIQARIVAPKTAVCLGQPLVVEDASAGKISRWEWSMGNGATFNRNTNDALQYQYPQAGTYAVRLKVTGEDGCAVETAVTNLKVVSVKAGFSMADTVAGINMVTQFTNTSTATPASSLQYHWAYAGGAKTSTNNNLAHTYNKVGWDTVKLIARTMAEGCADTLVKAIRIVNFNARFNYDAAYINGNACPPMLVKFKNLSKGTTKNLWDFGDGSTAQNQEAPQHIYRTGGTYTITLYTFGLNNTKDSASEKITVKGPSATISADKLFGCLNQKVTLTARVEYAKDYYWDFGDGTVLHTRDTFSLHHYQTAGVYRPALVMKDSLGCSVSAELPQPVVIDSLHLGIEQQKGLWCDSAQVTFRPRVVSVASDLLGLPLAYRWQTASASDTAAVSRFGFKGEGKHGINLTAISPFGCVQQAIDTVVMGRTVKGAIQGAAQVCVDKEITFSAQVPEAAATWRWMMPGGASGAEKKSPAQAFTDSGYYPVKLVVDHKGCQDTSTLKLQVQGRPRIQLARRAESICLGQDLELQASGGTSYSWEGVPSVLDEMGTGNAVVKPIQNAWYRVVVKNAIGCESRDSVFVRVHQPFKMSVAKEAVVCTGFTIELEASGAAAYQWMGPAGTLQTQSGTKVVARPAATALYRVVGRDSARCFTDTADIKVQVAPLPSVKTGPDQLLFTGSEVALSAKGSADVVSYQWAPADYLSCTNCQQTVAQPRKPVSYTVTAQNQYGCIARDTIRLNLQCTDSRIFIPNAFTPDGNGLNETFRVRGKGVSLVKSFRIYDRWGGIVFQSHNTGFEDALGGWNGTINGQKAPAGAYVYVAELICDTGEPIVKKGTVMLIR